jgi:hypothetical protein
MGGKSWRHKRAVQLRTLREYGERSSKRERGHQKEGRWRRRHHVINVDSPKQRSDRNGK